MLLRWDNNESAFVDRECADYAEFMAIRFDAAPISFGNVQDPACGCFVNLPKLVRRKLCASGQSIVPSDHLQSVLVGLQTLMGEKPRLPRVVSAWFLAELGGRSGTPRPRVVLHDFAKGPLVGQDLSLSNPMLELAISKQAAHSRA